ncbi:uncharacterized protein BT62DRAFT_921947 [Guyanagaster necrorhizus]|uniref:C2H2-type domain-containing protein n=1 Tax=Guyanagaster necrorhizus TaxID=856835 RepID=A0A9P7VMQ8_9AGAR|nr:uncharacterized protein BT62DRAFT_921947 [Guyanagaster necrorhizus MCA 3950]KAG7443462.1 hypothetical protein BT62DRAFT_921947 [Guyanagaster necrorhizus MCA 3950]
MAENIDLALVHKKDPPTFPLTPACFRIPPMARVHAKNPKVHQCTHPGCKKKFTRANDVQRHEKTHLEGNHLEIEKYPCLITEVACPFSSLQLSNLKAHIHAKHAEVEHLMCFDCRPTYRRFVDAAELAEHRQVEHPLTKIRSHRRQYKPSKPRRKVTKDIVSPPLVPLSPPDDVPPRSPPTDRFLLPPTAPPPRTSTLPISITIPPSAFHEDESQPPCDPSPPLPQWYRAPKQLQHHPKLSSLQKEARDTSGIKHTQQLPSPTLSSSTTGESSATNSRFPLPPPLPF